MNPKLQTNLVRFRYLLYLPTPKLALVVVSIYTAFFLAFVPVYMLVSTACNLQLGDKSGNAFLDAFYLSVETAVTIGYVRVPLSALPSRGLPFRFLPT